jgi:hypothetical protein
MFNRRDVLKMIGSLGAFIFTPLNKIVNRLPTNLLNDDLSTGELYSGFLLLEMGAPIPSFVEIAPVPVAGYDEGQRILMEPYSGVTTYFDNIEGLKADINFPIFIPDSLAHKMKFLQGQVIRFKGSGKVWEASYAFGSEVGHSSQVYLSARPVFSHPYPVWPIRNLANGDQPILDDKDPGVKPNKVDITPNHGLWFHHDQADTLQWIKHDVLYTLSIENQSQSDLNESVVKSLKEK